MERMEKVLKELKEENRLGNVSKYDVITINRAVYVLFVKDIGEESIMLDYSISIREIENSDDNSLKQEMERIAEISIDDCSIEDDTYFKDARLEQHIFNKYIAEFVNNSEHSKLKNDINKIARDIKRLYRNMQRYENKSVDYFKNKIIEKYNVIYRIDDEELEYLKLESPLNSDLRRDIVSLFEEIDF